MSAVSVLVDFGVQPPSNRYELAGSTGTETHPLIVGQCAACGLIQLVTPMPPRMAKSRYEWVTYNEPEGHLDDLVAHLVRLPGLAREARIAGLSYKDDTTLARFNRLGYANTYRYDMREDLGLPDPCAGLESIQQVLDASMASTLASRHGLAELLLVRHVLEHAHDPAAFLASMRALVKPGGYIAFEMPDCTKFVKACDYSFIWEEHITYFSAPTLAAFLAAVRIEPVETIVYPYPLEDSLIAIVRNREPAAPAAASQALAAVLAEGQTFGTRRAEIRAQVQAQVRAWREEGKRVAVFGAGHLAAKFVNFFSLAGLVECVIDDNPNKQGVLMPGSRLPIRGSAELVSGGIAVCLLSLNPESEQKVRAKNQAYLDRGGQFRSIFALSPTTVYAKDAL